MAKRYYDSKKARIGNGYYAGYESRLMQEREDGSMLNEDRSQVANLPQEVIMKFYPKVDYAHYSPLNDTIASVDNQIDKDSSGKTIKKGMYPEMY